MRGIRRLSVAAPLAVAVLVAGCTLPPPQGQAPLRYRDEITQNLKITPDLTYSTSQDGVANPLKLDVYEPARDTVAKRPALVFVHGGGFIKGTKSGGGLAPTYARRGYVAISINYRLLPPGTQGCAGQGPTPQCQQAALDAQHDTQAAIRWLRANATTYKVDPDRIAVSGTSAGGVTSVLVATNSEDTGNSGNPGPSSKVQGAVAVSGGIPTDVFDPINAGDAPTIFFHGTIDNVVPYSWAVSNSQEMQQKGVPANLESFEGKAHGIFGDPEVRPTIDQQSVYWLYYQMGLEHAAR
jgi:acetyl esterase/lipase